MKHFTQFLAAAALSVAAALPAHAETTLTIHYPMPGFFKDVMDTISKKFMEENPDIKIQFAAPSATYEDGIQLILRQAGTSEMPDITFIGLNRLRMLNERNVAVDMTPLVQKEGNMAEQGFSDTILKLAQVKGKQVGLAFATSNPIMYYNADLVKAAGGNPDTPPKTWDEVIALAGKIKALGNGVDGMDFRWQGDDWMFSALLFGAGGKMLSDDEQKVTFNGPEGQKAVELISRFVKEGGMPVFTKAAGEQAFAAGKVGFEFQTTGALVNTIKNVGAKFNLRTAQIPLIDPDKGHLPTGGNAVVILAKDPAKQDAAWKFAKFAAGPYGASVVVPGTGYVPNNELAAKSAEYLGDFYKKNPLFQAGLSQMPRMIPW
jgi:multiple sugar transport system substrate-binding protein